MRGSQIRGTKDLQDLPGRIQQPHVLYEHFTGRVGGIEPNPPDIVGWELEPYLLKSGERRTERSAHRALLREDEVRGPEQLCVSPRLDLHLHVETPGRGRHAATGCQQERENASHNAESHYGVQRWHTPNHERRPDPRRITAQG